MLQKNIFRVRHVFQGSAIWNSLFFVTCVVAAGVISADCQDELSQGTQVEQVKVDNDWVKTIAPGVRLIGRRPPFAELGKVDSIIALPDGERLLVSCDRGLCVCEIKSEKILIQRKMPGNNPTRIYASPDKRRFVLVHEFYSPDEEELVESTGHLEQVELVCLNEDFEETGSLVLGAEYFQNEESHSLVSLCFSPDGNLFVGLLHQVQIVADSRTGEIVQKIQYPEWVTSCAFSPDGQQLYLFGDDPRAFDLEFGEPLRRTEFVANLAGQKPGLWFPAPDGRTALMTVAGGVVSVDASTGKKIGSLELASSMATAVPRFSADGKVACSVVNNSSNNTGEILGLFWSVADGKEIGRIKVERMTWDFECSADGQTMFLPNVGGSGLRGFSRNTDVAMEPVASDFLPVAYSLAFNTNGTRIAMSSFPKMRMVNVDDGSVSMVNSYGSNLRACPADERFVSTNYNFLSCVIDEINGENLKSKKRAEISSSQEIDVVRGLLAIGGASPEGAVKLFPDFPLDTVFSLDGKQLFGLFHQCKRGIVLRTWSDVDSPKTDLLVSMDRVSFTPALMGMADGIVTNGRISPDGTWIAYLHDGEVFVIVTKTKEELHKFSVKSGTRGMEISGDGKLLATVSSRSIEIRDATTGESLKTIDAEKSRAAFSARSPRLLIAPFNGDDPVRVIDTDSWQTVREYRSDTGNRISANISADGRLVIISLADGRLEHWRLDEMD